MTPRYHPEVIWGPFVLALALGLVISAGLYFAYLWPSVEPDEPEGPAEPAREGVREVAQPASADTAEAARA
ncbi:hypothetical protein BH11MYX1_BH11MYX1_53060 [soil metagenome]